MFDYNRNQRIKHLFTIVIELVIELYIYKFKGVEYKA